MHLRPNLFGSLPHFISEGSVPPTQGVQKGVSQFISKEPDSSRIERFLEQDSNFHEQASCPEPHLQAKGKLKDSNRSDLINDVLIKFFSSAEPEYD